MRPAMWVSAPGSRPSLDAFSKRSRNWPLVLGGPVVPSPRVPRKSPQAMVRPVLAANWSCLRVVAPMALFSGGFVHHTQAHKLKLRPAVRCGKSRIGMASGAGIANLDLAGVVLSWPLEASGRLGERLRSRQHELRQRAWGTINAGPRLLLHIASCTMSWQTSGWEASQPVPPGLPTPEARQVLKLYVQRHCTALEWTAGPSWPCCCCCCCYQCHPVVSRNHPQSPCICCYSALEFAMRLCRLPAPTRRRERMWKKTGDRHCELGRYTCLY